MYSKFLKGLVFLVYVGGTAYLCRSSAAVVAITIFFTAMLAGVSLDPRVAVQGYDSDPGLLIKFSVILVLGPLAFMDLLPELLYQYGISSKVHTLHGRDIFIDLIVGVMFTVYIWIPFALYRLIDLLTKIFHQKAAPAN